MIQAVYEDTDRKCGACDHGTYVIYPDGKERCRYCGDINETVVKTVGRKTNG